MFSRLIISSIMLGLLLGLNACDSEPPTLMKASKQFESDEIRDRHIAYMRINHMVALKHKRDETLYKGIRTEKNSINACINCHVPENYKGKVLRHTDQEHFCTTCHTYVAAQLNCFECHVDHPVKTDIADSSTSSLIQLNSFKPIEELDRKELIKLAFKYSKSDLENQLGEIKTSEKEKPHKSGGVSFYTNKASKQTDNNNSEAKNE